jgi:hypothetical protein
MLGRIVPRLRQQLSDRLSGAGLGRGVERQLVRLQLRRCGRLNPAVDPECEQGRTTYTEENEDAGAAHHVTYRTRANAPANRVESTVAVRSMAA